MKSFFKDALEGFFPLCITVKPGGTSLSLCLKSASNFRLTGEKREDTRQWSDTHMQTEITYILFFSEASRLKAAVRKIPFVHYE